MQSTSTYLQESCHCKSRKQPTEPNFNVMFSKNIFLGFLSCTQTLSAKTPTILTVYRSFTRFRNTSRIPLDGSAPESLIMIL